MAKRRKKKKPTTNNTRFRLVCSTFLLLVLLLPLALFAITNLRSLIQLSGLFLFILCDTRGNIVIGTRENVNFIAMCVRWANECAMRMAIDGDEHFVYIWLPIYFFLSFIADELMMYPVLRVISIYSLRLRVFSFFFWSYKSLINSCIVQFICVKTKIMHGDRWLSLERLAASQERGNTTHNSLNRQRKFYFIRIGYVLHSLECSSKNKNDETHTYTRSIYQWLSGMR